MKYGKACNEHKHYDGQNRNQSSPLHTERITGSGFDNQQMREIFTVYRRSLLFLPAQPTSYRRPCSVLDIHGLYSGLDL